MRTLKVSLKRDDLTIAIFDFDGNKLPSEVEVVGLLARTLITYLQEKTLLATAFDVVEAEKAINEYSCGEHPCKIAFLDW